MGGWTVFLKAHWRRGFWDKRWFWLSFRRWEGVGFAALFCGVELAVLKAPMTQGEEKGR